MRLEIFLLRSSCFVLLLLAVFSFLSPVMANDLVIRDLQMSPMDPKTRRVAITFNITWSDSWRGPVFSDPRGGNWDAAWVFCKFSRKNSDYGIWDPWTHCDLNPSGTQGPSEAVIEAGKTDGVGKGIFIYSAGAKALGAAQYNGIKIEWLAGDQGVLPTDEVQVKLFGLEMVYVPQGSFAVGNPKMSDAALTGTPNAFRVSGCENALRNCAYWIMGESPVDIGAIQGYLSYPDKGDLGTPLGEAFPKGFKPFYVMKYELSQGQYRDFLNSLTRDQQKKLLGDPLPEPGQFVFSATGTLGVYRNAIRRDPGDPDYPRRAAKFGCDATGGRTPDGVLDQSDDGEWVAMNYLNLSHILSYAGWAALRPLTEFEYEKAARGIQDPVPSEYAWGNVINNVGNVDNKGMYAPFEAGEYANCSHVADGIGGCNYGGVLCGGPYRVGSFLSQRQVSSDLRFDRGAGYYGAQELSGNVFDPAVSIGTKAGRDFRGNHGDGSLNIPADWPGNPEDMILRGGSFLENNSYIATRQYLLSDKADQLYKVGGRFARSAR